MIHPDTFRFLWEYMVHADQQIAAAAMTVPAENFAQEQNISMGSLPKLLNHARIAQKVWLRRLNGEDFMYADEPIPAREQFAEIWSPVHQELLAFADAQTPESLQKMVRSRNRAGKRFEVPAYAVMFHVADHATYHRGQLNSMIKRAGGTPSPVMVYTYAISQGLGREL
jgi:uncharacterized damage-inducible protein DinB